MSGYVEVAVATGEKRQHTVGSLTRRLAAIQRGAFSPKTLAHVDEQIREANFIEINHCWFRLFSISLDSADIPYALETGAWGKVVPVV